MRSGKTLLRIAILALQPVWVFANVPNFGTNAVGENIYVPRLRQELLIPLAVIAVGFSLAALLAARRRANNHALNTAGSRHD